MSGPDQRIHVEPLPEARWSRIEESLFERLERGVARPGLPLRRKPLAGRSASARWVGATALVLAGGVAASLGVIASRSLSRGEFSKSDEVVGGPPSHIETGPRASRMVFGGATLDVDPQSEVVVGGSEAQGWLVLLERGRVQFEVTPRESRAPFVVQAGGVGVRVVGTRFSVSRTGAGTSVDVSRGTVEVSVNGDVHSVHAGERWPAAQSDAIMGPPVVSASVERAAVAPAGAPVASPADKPSARARPSGAAFAPPPGLASAHVAESAVRSLAPSALPDARDSRRVEYENAAKLEPTDPTAALAGYRELASGSDAWAINALFAAARLQADRGNGQDARALANEYLARFPRGPNASDAREMLEKLRRRGGAAP